MLEYFPNINWTRLSNLFFLYNEFFENKQILSSLDLMKNFVEKVTPCTKPVTDSFKEKYSIRTADVTKEGKVCAFKKFLSTLTDEEIALPNPPQILIMNNSSENQGKDRICSSHSELNGVEGNYSENFYWKEVKSMIARIPKSKIIQFYSKVVEISYFYKNGNTI